MTIPIALYQDDSGKYWYIANIPTKIFVLYHREDGPALELTDGRKVWYSFGKVHRLYSPAYFSDESERWFVNDVDLTHKIEQWIIDMNLPHYSEWNDQHKVLFKLTWG